MEEVAKVTNNKLPTQDIDYVKILKIIASRWYLIAGSVVFCYIVARVYLWYTPKIYATYATLKFEDKKSEIGDLAGFATPTERTNVSKVQSETIVLQSTALLTSAIRQLDYRISFYVVGRVLSRTNELYPQKPLHIELVKFDSLNFAHQLFTFKPLKGRFFSLSYQNGSNLATMRCAYNSLVTVGPTTFTIADPGNIAPTSQFLFKFNSPEDFLGRVRGGLHIAETVKYSNIISLQETDQNPVFAADILNAIMREYLVYDVKQRNQSATQMIRFIDRQLDFLANALKAPDTAKKGQVNKKHVLDMTSNASRIMEKATTIESQASLLKIDLLSIDQLKKEVAAASDAPLANLNLGMAQESQVNTSISSLNNLIGTRQTALKTYRSNSQYVKDIDQQILEVKNGILNSINATRVLIENKIQFLQSQLQPVNQQISDLPTAQRELVSLQRDFEINDKVYSFLSEKKLGAQINSAGILPGATIIDLAQPNLSPVAPDEASMVRTAEILGFAIGLGLIILVRIINPYIYDKETIESLTYIPILGVIRKYPHDIDEYSSQILALSQPKSVFAESVRAVRTNLSFLASEKTNKVICITSEVAGEGKSFVAVNLSSTLSLIEKKVILIAADLRRSKLHKTFQIRNDLGLSNYLANQCALEDVLIKTNQKNLDIIVSGPVPPNPSELLHSKKMADLIEHLKSLYDIIMIDTAPVGLVSDAIPLIMSCDINLFVIRAGKSKYYAATVPQRIAQEYHLENTVIVLNAYQQDLLHSRYYTTKLSGEAGTKYYYYSNYTDYDGGGYYVDNDKEKWWNIMRWFKKNNDGRE